jgi:hypothetical protein
MPESMVTGLDFQPGIQQLQISLTGHPDHALAKAHEIASAVLSAYGPWRITDIRYSCGDMVILDSAGEMEVMAMVKEIREELKSG